MSRDLFKRSGIRVLLAGLAPVAVGVVATVISLSAAACPASNAYKNFKDSSIVGASSAGAGPVSYSFSSVDRTPSNGVPGLIEYCVYPNSGLMPGNVDAVVQGYNGGFWDQNVKAKQGYFSFGRPNGNPTNVPLNGASNVLIGVADASGPGRFLLHINDAAECNALYGGNPGTCWVKPALAPPACVPPEFQIPGQPPGVCGIPA